MESISNRSRLLLIIECDTSTTESKTQHAAALDSYSLLTLHNGSLQVSRSLNKYQQQRQVLIEPSSNNNRPGFPRRQAFRRTRATGKISLHLGLGRLDGLLSVCCSTPRDERGSKTVSGRAMPRLHPLLPALHLRSTAQAPRSRTAGYTSSSRKLVATEMLSRNVCGYRSPKSMLIPRRWHHSVATSACGLWKPSVVLFFSGSRRKRRQRCLAGFVMTTATPCVLG